MQNGMEIDQLLSSVFAAKPAEVKLETGNQSEVPITPDRRMIAGTLGVEEGHQTDLMIKRVELPRDFDCQGSCSTPAGQQYRTLRTDSKDLFHIGRRPVHHGLRLSRTKQFTHAIYRPILLEDPGQHPIEKVGMNDEQRRQAAPGANRHNHR